MSKLEKGLSKCWEWDETIKEYRFKSYTARKKGLLKKENTQSFQDLKAAKHWLYNINVPNPQIDNSPVFSDIFTRWQNEQLSTKRYSTITFYKSKYKYLEYFANMPIESIRPVQIDSWIKWLKTLKMKNIRTSFNKEIKFLRTLFQFYKDRHEGIYDIPIRPYHFAQGKIKDKVLKQDILPESDFIKFRNELEKDPNTKIYAALATVQFYQCLRISEIAALHKEDINLSEIDSKNKIHIRRKVEWARLKGDATRIVDSFKNSSMIGIKSSVLHPESKHYLVEYYESVNSGLVFNNNGEPLSYRSIQANFDKAFKAAGLPFRSTHCLRKGGATAYYNDHGSTSLVQSQLGVTNLKTAQVYAKPIQKESDDYMASLYKKRK